MSANSDSVSCPKTRSRIASARSSLSMVSSKSFNDRYSSATAKPVLLFASDREWATAMLAAYLAAISKTSSRPVYRIALSIRPNAP